MKIYTKTGDKGETALIGGVRVPKNHIRIEAYGTLDELNAHIGMVKDLVDNPALNETLLLIQDKLFVMGAELAKAPGKEVKMILPVLLLEDVTLLENKIDEMEGELPKLTSFILPGGHQAASAAHIARCVCRRAERVCVALGETETTDPLVLQYLNRLSDYLFVLSRFIVYQNGAEEVKWVPGK